MSELLNEFKIAVSSRKFEGLIPSSKDVNVLIEKKKAMNKLRSLHAIYQSRRSSLPSTDRRYRYQSRRYRVISDYRLICNKNIRFAYTYTRGCW